MLKKLEDDSADRQQEAEQLQAEIRRLKHICQATQLELDKLHKLSGELKARKNTYDKEEQQYNQRYATRLQRNLMGLYDDGMLDILGEELADKLTSLTKNIADNSEAIAKTEEAVQNYEREIQSIQTQQMQNHRNIDHGEMQLQELNKQLAQRQDMLKYADLPEKEIYNGQLIQTKLVEKVQRLQGDIRRGGNGSGSPAQRTTCIGNWSKRGAWRRASGYVPRAGYYHCSRYGMVEAKW